MKRVQVRGILTALASLLLCATPLVAFAGAGSSGDADGDAPIVEMTVKEKSKEPGKTDTRKSPSKKDLEALRKKQRAELKRLEGLYKKCKKAAKTDHEREACYDTYLADRVKIMVDPRDVAREVVARLQLPASTPIIGPAPELNVYSPGDLVVNYPYWLSVPGKSTLSTTETSDGLTLTLTAKRTQVVFDMGNGDIVTCTKMLPWPGQDHELDRHGRPVVSPVCGYHYPDRGTVAISATVTWDVAWSGGGLSGVIRLTHTDSVELDVVELHSVNR